MRIFSHIKHVNIHFFIDIIASINYFIIFFHWCYIFIIKQHLTTYYQYNA